MNTIELLERLTEKQCEVDWDEDDLATLHAALPALLKLARAVKPLTDIECLAYPLVSGPDGRCAFCGLREALDTLLRGSLAGEPHEQREGEGT